MVQRYWSGLPSPLWGGNEGGGRPHPRSPQLGRQRIKAQLQIIGQGADQRPLACPLAARHAGQRHDQVAFQLALRRLAKHMQAIADLGFLQVAEEVVDLDQRLQLILGQANIAIEPSVADKVENAATQVGEATAVHAGGGVVFVE